MEAAIAHLTPSSALAADLLRDRADDIVSSVLERNARRWETAADAERAAQLATALVEHLLRVPLDYLLRVARSEDAEVLAQVEDLLGLQ
jgi:hypothetical protein